MKKCKYCSKEGYKDKRNKEYNLCKPCLSKERSSKGRNSRPNKAPNKYILLETYAIGLITNWNGEYKAYFKVSLSDLDKVTPYCWSKMNTGYIYNSKAGLMHRFLLPCTKDLEIDHINKVRFDNRTSNLRVVNRLLNSLNTSLNSNNKSGYAGVVWKPENNKWVAYGGSRGKQIYLGIYSKLQDAVNARKTFMDSLYKEESKNFKIEEIK